MKVRCPHTFSHVVQLSSISNFSVLVVFTGGTRLTKFILISTTASRWLPLFSLGLHRVLAPPLSRISRGLGKISSDISFSLSMIDKGTAVNAPCHCCWLAATLLYTLSDIRRRVHIYKRCDARAGSILIRLLQQVRAHRKKKSTSASYH